jgi:thiamine biosynthesis lipoprotein
MGTDVHVVVHGDPALADLAEAEVRRLEALWSRFLPHSEVSELNRRSGEWVPVSEETRILVDRAIEGARATGGRFDPTVLGDVLRAGYDRTFDEVVALGDHPAPTSHLGHGVEKIALDPVAQAVRLPAGVGFDPGGIGKGLAADLVAGRLDREGVAGALVNIGGDLRAVGYGPAGDDWTVTIDPAASGAPVATVSLEGGAVATSTILRRRWVADGAVRHHLIDPATGRPAEHPLVSATVIAARGWQAEVLAKAALLAGVDEGLALVEARHAEALLVDDHGGLHRTSGFDRFVVPDRTEVAP